MPRVDREFAPPRTDNLSTGRIVGTGIGLRSCHIDQVLSERPMIPWFELLADNHTAEGGLIRSQLDAITDHWPVTLHCVGMNVGGTDPLDVAYLKRIATLSEDTNAAWVSDHLCFTACHGRQFHDLLPLPYTQEALAHITARVHQIQDVLGRALVLENVSAYLRYRDAEFTEAQFLAELVARTGCRLLLDLNNLYVNHVNHGEDMVAYLKALPLDAVQQMHLAGYEDQGEYLIDAHNNPVSQPVWSLCRDVLPYLPDVPMLIEWDSDIPAFSALCHEAEMAEAVRQKVICQQVQETIRHV